jgi:hypothetical protein
MENYAFRESCQDCGDLYDYVWSAENDLWNEVVGSPEGFLCAPCFTRRCAAKNIFPYVAVMRESPFAGRA